MTWEFLLGIAGIAFVLFVSLSIAVFVIDLVVDAFRSRNGDDHEPPTLNTRGPDPHDPTSGVPS